MTLAALPLVGLARRLVTDELLEPEQAIAAMKSIAATRKSLIRHLVAENFVDSHVIAQVAAEEFGVPLFDLSALDPKYNPRVDVESSLMKKHHVIPLFRNGSRLYLATSDPANDTAISDIKFHTGLSVDMVVVEDNKLALAIERLDQNERSSEKVIEDLNAVDLAELKYEIEKQEETTLVLGGADEAPIVKTVNKILLDATSYGASDIHIEPYEKIYRIRYRMDGILHEISKPPISVAGRIAARLKIMSQMDIAERRLPQDGRIRLKLTSDRSVDFRVSTLPTLWGEKLVLRILDPSQAKLGIDLLGFEAAQKNLFLAALQKPHGMVLVTGPTGSGKTVTLYSGLNLLNQAQRNISTAEDPVEINVEGINQVQINARIGLDFASALRAFMRQDPDVVMLGEIRDLETAEIAIKAAQTGHLLLSTLHTNSASEAIPRLRNMGIASYNLASSISLVVAQRLARKLCNLCKEKVALPEKILKEEGLTQQISRKLDSYKAVGCNQCFDGYKGRVGIYEVVPITGAISRIIIRDGNSIDIAEQAQKEGFHTLRHSALIKVAQGLISLEEANRLT